MFNKVKSILYLQVQILISMCFFMHAVHGKVVNKFESEMLCRACVYLYLGDDPLDKEAKEKFGMSLLSLV